MSMRSLAVIIEQSLGRCSVLADTATVTGRGTLDVDASARNGDFRWPPAETSRGHQRGPQLATSGDFLMATDTRSAKRGTASAWHLGDVSRVKDEHHPSPGKRS